jgi:lipoprotein-releasing system ATP-binding protein
MNTELVLRTNHITKYFETPVKFKALDDVSISAYKGEFLTLVGKSGSGKSTLLYCISTMDRDFEGDLFINDIDLSTQSAEECAKIRNEYIGFIFQSHYLLPEFSVLQNVILPALKLNKFSQEESEVRALEKLKLLGIEDQALKPAKKLSGGQQQRVAIARALINEPLLVLCDEPTGNLDSRNTSVVLDIFKSICHEQGKTIIAVTHDLDFAKSSDRTLELADGKLVSLIN